MNAFVPKVLKSINMSIAAGSTVAILGGRESGKSSLMKELQLIHKPNNGKVRKWVSLATDAIFFNWFVSYLSGLNQQIGIENCVFILILIYLFR